MHSAVVKPSTHPSVDKLAVGGASKDREACTPGSPCRPSYCACGERGCARGERRSRGAGADRPGTQAGSHSPPDALAHALFNRSSDAATYWRTRAKGAALSEQIAPGGLGHRRGDFWLIATERSRPVSALLSPQCRPHSQVRGRWPSRGSYPTHLGCAEWLRSLLAAEQAVGGSPRPRFRFASSRGITCTAETCTAPTA
jgi:hypothetical protein